MRRLRLMLAALVALAAAVGLAASSASAGNAHFIKNATDASLSGSDLVCSFKEAGLESGSTETITCSATAETTYECVNKGGHNPSASNKTTVVSQVSGSGDFKADKSGNVTGSVTLSPPTAADLGFSCPSGQKVTFVSVTYSDVSISDATSGASQDIPGTFTFTNPDAP